MAFWSGDRLAADGPPIDLVEPFDPERIDCSAYTLTLGPECFVSPDFDRSEPNRRQRLDAPTPVQVGGRTHYTGGGEMVVPPGQFAFLLTQEFIKIPAGCMGFISLKSTVKWKGLINVSGFHVDPGFHGRLVYSVYNAGPSSIHLNRGDPLFLLWIADLDQPSGAKYRKPPGRVLTEIPSTLLSEIDRPLRSLQNLSDKLDALQADLKLLYRTLAALAVIGGLVLAAWALLPSRDQGSDAGSVQTVE